MKNRRAFSRQPQDVMVMFRSSRQECLGEIRNLGLGGLHARIPKSELSSGERVWVGPPNGDELEYEVQWVVSSGAGLEIGLSYPHSVAGFWQSWAADLLAGGRITLGEVVERRSQVRLECSLKAHLKVKRKQLSAVVLDLGAGGALVETEAPLESGQALQLTVLQPMRVGHLPCTVSRVWTDGSHRHGLSFVELKERHRLGLVRLMDLLFRQASR